MAITGHRRERRKKSLDWIEAVQWAEKRGTFTQSDSYPEDIYLNDFSEARRTYDLLEAFADGFGGWKVMDTLGKPLVDLPEILVDDLLTLRYLAGISEAIRSKEKREKGV